MDEGVAIACFFSGFGLGLFTANMYLTYLDYLKTRKRLKRHAEWQKRRAVWLKENGLIGEEEV